MKHATIIAILIIALLSVANAQTINSQTLAQMVEGSNGQMKDSFRSILKIPEDKNQFWLEEPASMKTGHRYLSFNSLGKSSLTAEQVMNVIKADPNRVFPYFDAVGDCGQKVKKGNIFTLILTQFFGDKDEARVEVTDVGTHHFTFTALPHHQLQGSATHGVFKDGSGELWLYQVGKGVVNETIPKQDINYIIAKFMWSHMAENVRDMMSDIELSDQSDNSNDVDSIVLVRNLSVKNVAYAQLQVCQGDSVSIVAEGKIAVGDLGNYTVGPSGVSSMSYTEDNFEFGARCNHASLILLIKQDSNIVGYACVGSRIKFISKTKGKIELWVNDSNNANNSGAFRARIKVERSK